MTVVKRNAYRLRLEDFLRGQEEGKTVTHATLSKEAGIDVTSPYGRSVMTGARRTMLRENIVYGAVRGVGLRRLPPEEIASEAASYRRRGVTSINRAAQMVGGVDSSKLIEEDRAKLHAEGMRIFAIKYASEDARGRRLTGPYSSQALLEHLKNF